MVVRGPVVALVLLGLVPAALWPGRAGVVAAGWLLGVALLVVVDLLLTPSPRSLLADRGGVPAVRLGGSTTAELPLTNDGARRVRGLVQDAWVPSAGADGTRHLLDVAPGQVQRVRTTLTPTRRGDRPATGLAVRVHGPMGLA